MQKKVLIVDDEILIAMFLQDVVEDAGFEICGIAASLDEARTTSASAKPDIAIVDMNLRGSGSGLDVGRHLVETYGTAVIFITGEGDLAGRSEMGSINPVAVLQKPCLPNAIERALQSAEQRLAA